MKIGFWELVVIVVIAFVFIGPDQLPVYAKKLGKMLRELKKYTGAASEEIQKNVVEPLNEIQAPLKEAVAPLTDIKKDIDNSVKDVTKSFTGIGKTSKEEAAKAEQRKNMSRIRYLKQLLASAVVIDAKSGADEVGLFDRVVLYLEDDDEEMTVRFVTTLRQNALEGLISKESPLGAAVIGHKAGERVYVRVNDDYGYYAEIRSIEKGQDDASLEISAY